VVTFATSGFLVGSLGTTSVYVGASALAGVAAVHVEWIRGNYRQRAQAMSQDLKRITQTQSPVAVTDTCLAR
jgi:hypothetical protein